MELGKKISIIGGAGTGKTTLSKNLGKMLNIPTCHLDGINYFEKETMKKKRYQVARNK